MGEATLAVLHFPEGFPIYRTFPFTSLFLSLPISLVQPERNRAFQDIKHSTHLHWLIFKDDRLDTIVSDGYENSILPVITYLLYADSLFCTQWNKEEK